MHYLLTVGCAPTASQMAFADRFKDASRTRGLKGKNCLGPRQNRLVKVVQKKKKMQFACPTLKIAASLLILLGCAVLYKNLFYRTPPSFPEISKSDETCLDWNYEPEIIELKKNIAMFYGSLTPTTYLYANSENEIIKKREKINEMISRSEKLWP
jgi:hypothetical protein